MVDTGSLRDMVAALAVEITECNDEATRKLLALARSSLLAVIHDRIDISLDSLVETLH